MSGVLPVSDVLPYSRRSRYRASVGCRCGVSRSRFAAKSLVEVAGSFETGVRASPVMVTSRAKIELSERKLLNWETSSWDAGGDVVWLAEAQGGV
jgi:hypothetical protein